MKRIIMLASLVFIVSTSCTNNMDGVLDGSDVLALQNMKESFENASLVNQDLSEYIEQGGKLTDEICFELDSVFHDYDSIFEENHDNYSHSNNGDDHQSGSWMMGMGWTSGNMMSGSGHNGNSFNTNSCTSINLELMDSLMNAHIDLHPGN